MSAGRSKVLMELGILILRNDPERIVAPIRKYRHPNTGLTVTLLPVPGAAMPEFWEKTIYGNHNRYSVVLVEDGRLPAASSSPFSRQFLIGKKILPFLAFRDVVDDSVLPKYIGTNERDKIESAMSYQSCLKRLNPPVDSRARRGMEKLLELNSDPSAAKTTVGLPWNLYHMYYFMHRLNEEGFQIVGTEEAVVFERNKLIVLVGMIAATMSLLLAVFVRLVLGF